MTLADIERAFQASLGLARRDKDAMAGFDVTADGFYRSFFAAIVVLPIYIAHLMADRMMAPQIATLTGQPTRLIEIGPFFLAVESLVYVSEWVLFPIAFAFLARPLRVEQRYVPFIVAYNWSTTITILAILPAIALVFLGVASPETWVALNFAATAFLIYFRCFVAATALQTSVIIAAGIVLFDIVLSIFLVQGIRSLYSLV